MKRWLPSPLVSGLLLLLWLLLNQSLAASTLLLGAALAIVIPLLAQALLQPLGYPRVLKWGALFSLLGMALVEIVVSSVNVAGLIWRYRWKRLNSTFLRIPLDLRNPYGLALLSCLVNSTPGTVWVEILPQRRELVLHVFDLHDEQWWIDTIKNRYERPIIAIFEVEHLS